MRSLSIVAWRRHRYAVLLGLLLVSLTIQSFTVGAGVPEMFSDIFRTVLGVSIFLVVFEGRAERVTMVTVLVATVAIGWGRHLLGASLEYPLLLTFHALMTLYLAVAVGVILRGLFRASRTAVENVLGAICGYLIAGDAWASVNALTYVSMPATYSINPAVNALLTDWHGRFALFSYYSISQMLTLGYTDVTPVRAPATTLALLTTLFGVFYTAVVVSQFVALAAARREMRDRR